jgi:hypothetical protein
MLEYPIRVGVTGAFTISTSQETAKVLAIEALERNGEADRIKIALIMIERMRSSSGAKRLQAESVSFDDLVRHEVVQVD